MLEKPRKIHSLDTLRNYLSEKDGSAPGIYIETEVERDGNGEILTEEEHPVEGDYRLITDPETDESLLIFQIRETDEAQSITVSAFDVMTGAVEVLARHDIK